MPTQDLSTHIAALEPLATQLVSEWMQHTADGFGRADVWWMLSAFGRLGYAAETLDRSLAGADRQAIVDAVVGAIAGKLGMGSTTATLLVRVVMPVLSGVAKLIGRWI